MSKYWFLLRLALVISDFAVVFTSDIENVNLNWEFGIFAGTIAAVVAVGSFIVGARSDSVEFTNLYSWDSPFFPTARYQVKYWIVGTSTIALGAGLATIIAYFISPARVQFGLTICLIGLIPFMIIYLWVRIFRSEKN